MDSKNPSTDFDINSFIEDYEKDFPEINLNNKNIKLSKNGNDYAVMNLITKEDVRSRNIYIAKIHPPTLNVLVSNPNIEEGVQIGDGVKIYRSEIKKNVVLNVNSKIGIEVFLGEDVIIGKNSEVTADYPATWGLSLHKRTVIGDNCKIIGDGFIGPKAYIANDCMLRGNLHIEENVIQSGARVKSAFICSNVRIGFNFKGDNVSVSSLTNIGNNVRIDDLSKIGENSFIYDNVDIGKNVTVGKGIVISKFSKIGDYCFLGSTDFKDNMIYVGAYAILGSFVTLRQHVSVESNSKLEENVKIENHTNIGHSTTVGKNVNVGQYSNIGSRVVIGENSVIGNYVTILDNISIKSDSVINDFSVIDKNE